MFDQGRNGGGCRFSADLLPYLYNEASEGDMALFRAHLGGCAACGSELESLGTVRNSLIEWQADFRTIETPAISIPYETSPAPPPIRAADGLIRRTRLFFAESPIFGIGSAAFAAVLLGAALFFVARTLNNNEVAVTPAPHTPIAASASPAEVKATPEIASSNANTGIADPAELKRIPETVAKDDDIPREATQREGSVRSRTEVPAERRTVPRRVRSVTPPSGLPKLANFEEDEDKSLRLADLFAEIGTR